MNEPITHEQMRELMIEFVEPIYIIIGAVTAFCMIALAILIVIYPFIRRTK